MNLIELFKKTKTTTSTLGKVELIKDFFECIEQNEHGVYDVSLLEKYIDPLFVTYFSKQMIKNAGKMTRENDTVSSNQIAIIDSLLANLFNRVYTGNDAIVQYNNAVNVLDDDHHELLDTILAKSPTGISDKLVNKAHKELHGENFIDIFACQLANKYESKKDYKVDCWFETQKLDGLRCLYREGKLWTRGNKLIEGFEHIENELAVLQEKHNLDLIDGELYSHELPFQVIQGYVVRNKNINMEHKKQIKYNIFAVDGDDILSTPNMTATLTDMDTGNHEYLNFVHGNIIDNESDIIKNRAKEYVSLGYEGIMLRHPNIHYKYKRSNDLLKFKFFLENDFIITDVFEGEGKLAGMLGGFCLEGHGITSKVGSGFSEKQRKEFWDMNMIGKTAEIKYQDLTDDESSLRFPTFLKLKEDR